MLTDVSAGPGTGVTPKHFLHRDKGEERQEGKTKTGLDFRKTKLDWTMTSCWFVSFFGL